MATKIRGLDPLKKNLAKFMNSVEVKVLGDVITAGAEVMQGGMSMRAPVATGALAGEIEIEVNLRRAGYVLVKVGPSPESFYGIFQEFGTRFHPASEGNGLGTALETPS